MRDSDYITLALEDAPVDPRTGNKVLYNASWEATNDSMVGRINKDWVRRELDWFASGSNSLDHMEPPVPQAFQACAGFDNTVNSAYGHILFDGGNDSLYHRALRAFMHEGLETRHSVAIISDRNIHELAWFNGRNDFICTNALNFMIDHTNRLHITAQMRSMDAVWGYRADYSMWNYLMDKMVDDLNEQMSKGMIDGHEGSDPVPLIQRGRITFQVANLHVYPRHFELLQQWAHKIYDDQERVARRSWMDKGAREALRSPFTLPEGI